jgi:uncharacterized protein (DUF58 family)
MNLQELFERGREIGEGLKIVLPSNIPGSMGGARIGKASGSSLEFRDYREYQPGDDIRRIDWRAYARSDKYVLKLYQEEIQPVVSLLTDVSSSMALPEAKAEASVLLSGIVLASAVSSDCAATWWSFGAGMKCLAPLSRNFPSAAPETPGGSLGLAQELSEKSTLLPRRGLRMVVSDFLWDISPSEAVNSLLKSGCPLLLACILGTEELNPKLAGIASLSDIELGGRLDMEIGSREREAYKERLSSHLSMWKDESLRSGAEFIVLVAEDIASGKITDLLKSKFFSA